ncbi:hypothetical protein KEM56_007703 [Ascosphaera pollenicola]|nr:hypothetical protein KEM56_007703 [Ascosphaera pollenicola]
MGIKNEGEEAQGLDTFAPPLLQTPSSSPKKRSKKTDDTEDDESPRKRQAGNKIKIPTCIEEASEEDRMLLRMKDEEGASWLEIRQAWEQVTGVVTGKTTLCNRYARIKANFTVVSEDDVSRLIDVTRAVEAELEREKLGRISKALVGAGGGSYDTNVIQKKLKELKKQGLLE